MKSKTNHIIMKTNIIMDNIREEMSPEMKKQMELSVSIANRIYRILEEKGMTQKDLARLMDKTETEVSRWLSGMHNLTTSTIAKISIALGEDIITPTRSPQRSRKKKTMASASC